MKLCNARASVQKMVKRRTRLSLITMLVAVPAPFVLLAFLAHPETVHFAARIHPDAFLLLFDHAALACLELALANDRRFLWAATMFAGLSADPRG